MGTQQVIPSQPGVDSAVYLYFPPGTVMLACLIARSGGNLCGPAVPSCDAQLGEWRLTASARQTAQQGLLGRIVG